MKRIIEHLELMFLPYEFCGTMVTTDRKIVGNIYMNRKTKVAKVFTRIKLNK